LKGLHRLRFQACGGAPFALKVCSSCLSLQWILFISAKKKKIKNKKTKVKDLPPFAFCEEITKTFHVMEGAKVTLNHTKFIHG
jgi:hypothetical protein